MKQFLRILFGIIAIVAMSFVLLRAISLKDAEQAIHALSWTSIGVIVVGVCLISVIKAVRFFFILRFGDISISLKNTIRIFMASQALTPLPGGEVGRAMLFKNQLNLHLKEVAGPVFLQAVMELWSATLWAVLCAVMFIGHAGGWLLIVLLGLLAVLSTPLFFSTSLPHLFDLLKKRGINAPWVEKTQTTFRNFEKLISSKGKTAPRRFWMIVIGLGLLGHACAGGLLMYIAFIEGVHLTFFQALFAAVMATLIQGILTVIPGGLGVTEGGLVGILSSFQLPLHSSIVITLIYRLATLPLSILISLFFLLLMYGKKMLQFFRPALH